MKILITGASGMVGRNLVEQYFISNNKLLTPSSQELDLCNELDVDQYVDQYKTDCIIHSAGKVGGIQANIRDPYEFLQQNLKMGMNIINSAYKYNIKQVINLGSSCMYPRGFERSILETDILTASLEPTNEGYALAKIAVAKATEYIANRDKSFHYTTLIPCNLYGKYDSFDSLKSHLIPAIIVKINDAIKINKPVVIWGDGNARREFMYVEDFADFIGYTLEKGIRLPAYLNVGLGHDYTIKEYYQIAAGIMNYKGNFKFNLLKPTGMKRKLVNIEKLSATGWRAKYSLKEGFKKTIDYYLTEIK